MTLRVSVVVPVYRSEASLAELHRRLTATVEGLDAVVHELVLVDDASPDGSWSEVVRLADLDPRVVGVRLAANVRQLRAILAGTSVASGEVLVVMDADLEDPPEAVAALVAAHLTGHDLVVARRIGRPRSPVRTLGSFAVNLAARSLRLPTDDVGSSFLLFTPAIEAGLRDVLYVGLTAGLAL